MTVDLWKDLAEEITKRLNADDVIDRSGEVVISLEEMASIIEKVIEQFARERITRINFKVKKNGDTFKTG